MWRESESCCGGRKVWSEVQMRNTHSPLGGVSSWLAFNLAVKPCKHYR